MGRKLIKIEQLANNTPALGFAVETLIGWWFRRQVVLSGGEVIDEEFNNDSYDGLCEVNSLYKDGVEELYSIGRPTINKNILERFISTGIPDSEMLSHLLDYGNQVAVQYSDIAINTPGYTSNVKKKSDASLLYQMYELFLRAIRGVFPSYDKLVIRPKYKEGLPAAYAGDFIVNDTLVEIKSAKKREITKTREQLFCEIMETLIENKHRIRKAFAYWTRFGLFDAWDIPQNTIEKMSDFNRDSEALMSRYRDIEEELYLFITGKELE